MLNALVEREELRQKLTPSVGCGPAVPEQQIAWTISRHFTAFSEHRETDAWHVVLEALVRDLTDSDLL